MLAVIPVRDGILPAGALEAVAEAGGRALVVGSAPSADELRGIAHDVALCEMGGYAPGRWANELGELLAEEELVVLPASPDGRDLAPRLALLLDRPLLAGAIQVTPAHARLARGGGLELHDVAIHGPVVVTLQPGVRGVTRHPATEYDVCKVRTVPAPGLHRWRDAVVVEVLPPDVSTMDLAEADRIFGGGAGLDDADRFARLGAVAEIFGASMGATRVITDRGWVAHQRQIGTTGVVVDPSLYVAFGISGAVQHTAGLGAPAHILSVNTDAHCPMMQMADVAIVSDANIVLDELARLVAADG